MKKRMARVGLISFCLFAVGLGYLYLVRLLGFGFPCFFYELTGLQCPGCGLTRALTALSRLELEAATRYNPMVWLYLAYAIWYGGWGTVRYVRGKEDPYLFGPVWLHVAVLVLILAFSVLRNLA